MVWLFAAVVLVLMVVHPGFRMVGFVLGGIAAVSSVVIVIIVLCTDHTTRVAQYLPKAGPYDTVAAPGQDPRCDAVSGLPPGTGVLEDNPLDDGNAVSIKCTAIARRSSGPK